MTEYTVLPWRIRFHRQICNEGGQVIAVCENPVEANARFIVTACNCHADLLEALKRVKKDIDQTGYVQVTTLLIVDELIRKAEETQ